jgi:hypothetical protein
LITDVLGTYKVTFTATDSLGNVKSIERDFEVVDTTKPVITIKGSNPINIEVGSSYTDAGATASR